MTHLRIMTKKFELFLPRAHLFFRFFFCINDASRWPSNLIRYQIHFAFICSLCIQGWKYYKTSASRREKMKLRLPRAHTEQLRSLESLVSTRSNSRISRQFTIHFTWYLAVALCPPMVIKSKSLENLELKRLSFLQDAVTWSKIWTNKKERKRDTTAKIYPKTSCTDKWKARHVRRYGTFNCPTCVMLWWCESMVLTLRNLRMWLSVTHIDLVSMITSVFSSSALSWPYKRIHFSVKKWSEKYVKATAMWWSWALHTSSYWMKFHHNHWATTAYGLASESDSMQWNSLKKKKTSAKISRQQRWREKRAEN